MSKNIKQKFTFSANEKLKGIKLVQQLFNDGQSFHVFPFKIFYKKSLFNDSFLKAGFGVSKKNFKKATDRNRIKRLMRECWRLNKISLTGILQEKNKCFAVFLIYIGNTLPAYADIYEKTNLALKRLEKIANENVNADF